MPAGNEELIREYVDRGRFASDTAFIVKEVGIARKAYEELAKAKISIQGSTKLPDIAAGIKDAEKASQALIKTQNEILKQKKLQVSLENEVLKQQKLQQVAADKLAKTKPAATTISVTNLPNTDGINKTTTALNALDIEQAQAANSATALGQSQIVLNKSLKQTTQSALELNKQAELKKQLDRQAAQELKNVVREENAVKGSLEQRRAALIRLNAVYDNQAPAERASASGQRLQKIIGGLDTQVKTLENTTGRSQRNVGNYGSAFDGITKGATKAFSALRFLANIIPGLGIGGLILALADPIISLTKSLFGFNEVSEKTKQQQEEIASSFKQAADNAGEEISKVTVLKTVLESDNSTRLQKITALKQLKEINVDYFGQLDIENGKVNGLSLAYDFYVSRLIRSINAKANIDLLTKALKEQNDIVGDLNKNNVQKDGPFNVKNLTEFQRFDAIRRFNIKFGEERKSGNKDEKNATLISPAQDQLIVDLLNAEVKVKSITDKIKDDVVNAFDPKKEKTTTTKKDGSLQALKEVEDGEFERYKKRQEEIIKTFEDLTSNEKLSYDERIAALQNYSNAVLALDKKQEV